MPERDISAAGGGRLLHPLLPGLRPWGQLKEKTHPVLARSSGWGSLLGVLDEDDQR